MTSFTHPDEGCARRQADRAAHEPSPSAGSRPCGEHPSRRDLLNQIASHVLGDPEFALDVLKAVERGHSMHREILRASYRAKDAGFLAAVALATAPARTTAVRQTVVPTIARAIHAGTASECERKILAEASAIEAATAGETPQSGSTEGESAASEAGDAQTPGEHS